MMKKIFSIAILAACCSLSLAAAPKKDKDKGFHFVPFPALSYNSDQGLLLGGKLSVYNYGDGTNYPNYDDKIAADFQWTSKGTRHFHLI